MKPEKSKERHVFAALLRMGLYTMIVLTPLMIVALLHPKTDHGFVYTVGKNFALVGFTIVAMQFVLSAHYRFAPKPVGIRMANQKGRVERAISYVRTSFFAARQFADIDDLNRQAIA